jgi:hypothetical protein
MRFEKFSLRFLFLLISFATMIFCFYQPVSAQSGRRTPKPSSTPSSIQPATTTEPSPSTEKTEPSEKIEYLLIVGEVQNDDSYSDTLMLNSTLNYCLQKLKNQPNLKLKAEVGGKMNFKEAQEAAKKGENIYILWISFVMENLGKGKIQVNYANFSILKPESAEKLFKGRIDSEKFSKNGGVTRAKRSKSEVAEIGHVGEEIIYRLLRWGWLT